MQPDQYGRTLLLQDKKPADPFSVFRVVVKRAPENLAGHIAQARLYSSAANFDRAIKEIKAAQARRSKRWIRR